MLKLHQILNRESEESERLPDELFKRITLAKFNEHRHPPLVRRCCTRRTNLNRIQSFGLQYHLRLDHVWNLILQQYVL